jgi:hypothetical protein
MIRFAGIRRMALLLTVFAALLLAGCAPSVVGKWKGNIDEWEFKQDGTMTNELSSPIGNVSLVGKYNVEGSKIILNWNGVKGFEEKAPAPGREAAKESMDFKFEGEKLILTSPGKPPVTLERVKQ